MSRKKRSSWGCVQKLSTNKYRLRWWAEEWGSYTRHSETFYGTRKQADRRLSEIRSGLDETASRGKARTRQRITIAEIYKQWYLPGIQEKLAANTLKARKSTWNKYVNPRWGNITCTDVRALDIQHWLDPITQKPAFEALSMLRQILDYAELYEIIPLNIARRRFKMPQEHKSRIDGAFTLQELHKIAQAARGTHTEGAILLMMFGSCRTGESLGVRADELYLTESHGIKIAVAPIERQVSLYGEISDTLKNRQSNRFAVVPEPWSIRLYEIAQERMQNGYVWLSDNADGQPLNQSVLQEEWRTAIQKAGLSPKAPRAARRSWETYMRWDMDIDRSKIEQMMGHALPGVTGEHYDKPTAQAFIDTVGKAFSYKPFKQE